VATDYLESDPYYKAGLGNVVPIPLPETVTFREVTPLQVADFFIWELQKHHLKSEEWFLLPDRPTDDNKRADHYRQWSVERCGTKMPIPRKSLEALMKGAAPVSSMIWDYDNLRQSHEFRNGVWA
jgi:hypothetical protein